MFGTNSAHVLLPDPANYKILLTQRKDSLFWVLPGGQVKDGESFSEAAAREVKEETGCKIKISRMLARYVSGAGFEKRIYFGEVLKGNPRLSPETLRIRWFSVSKLPIPMTLYEIQRIKTALQSFKKRKVTVGEVRVDYLSEFMHQLEHPVYLARVLLQMLESRMPRRYGRSY